MKTSHQIFYEDSCSMKSVADNSVNLIVTSPPYPMIQMWDHVFNDEISQKINEEKWIEAFELMHKELDKVWHQVNRVLKEWWIACINIWDATRSIGWEFRLYNNHSRITQTFVGMWFNNLPNILWRKPTNSPNKFMWSWVLPVWAYVTLEHEYILIFRKGKKRAFNTAEEKLNRQESAFFFEERNVRFSDIREILWTKQKVTLEWVRDRNAAYPFEIPYRLINMFSVYWDTVLDPYLWTGTTTIAAMVLWRNSIWVEIDKWFDTIIQERISRVKDLSHKIVKNRLDKHKEFMENRIWKKDVKYVNENIALPVVSWVEQKIKFHTISSIEENIVTYD